jgi:hypothetical protein
MLLPLGFSQNPKVNHNVSVILNKLFANENLEIFEMKENTTIFNLLLIMLHYWITKVIQNDNFLLNALTELLEILTKSGTPSLSLSTHSLS